ncbi:autotransporter outer membrane beta-barrel domain-containing protein [Selenomonadales bacterium OttesenSCG-928-I06]|nr:autotransporter outer membrane beta-barrel domain-containing protein [Selenomonadales bacterium OttesenSCG-928-I06]
MGILRSEKEKILSKLLVGAILSLPILAPSMVQATQILDPTAPFIVPADNSETNRLSFNGMYVVETSSDATYNIGDGSETLYLNNDGSSFLFSVGTGNTVVVNGNLDILLHGVSGSGTYHHFGQNSDTTFNGDLKIVNDFSQGTTWIAEEFQSYIGSKVTLNGKVHLEQITKSTGTGSITMVAARGGKITFNDDAYVYNRIIDKSGSGANGVYARTEGTYSTGDTDKIGHIVFNGNKTTIISISNKPDAVSAKKWHASFVFAASPSVIINSPITQVVGSINVFMGNVTANFSGDDSFWYGDFLTDRGGAGSLTLRGWNTGTITVSNGGEWGYFGDPKNDYKGKGIKKLTLTDGGIVNMYDEYLKNKWIEYGFLSQDSYGADSSVYPDIASYKHDYVYIGTLSGKEGIFQLDLNSTDRASSDMIYIGNYSKASDIESGNYLLESYPVDNLVNVSREDPLRFATVGAGSKDLVFADSMNIYGKYLFDYKCYVTNAPYRTSNDTEAGNAYEYDDQAGVVYYFDDVANNAIYNGKLYEVDVDFSDDPSYWTADRQKNYNDDIAEIDKILKEGSTNWIIYKTEIVPNEKTEVITGDYDALYGAWTNNDTLRKRLGDLRYKNAEEGIWARALRGKLKGDLFSSNYQTYQVGYDKGNKNGDTVKEWFWGGAFEYNKGKNNYNLGSGKNEIASLAFYATKKGMENENFDVIFKVGNVDGQLDLYAGDEKLKGDYDTKAISLSMEYNKRYDRNDGYFYEPQAQLTIGRIKGYDYKLNDSIRINNNGINSAIARLGVLGGKEFSNGKGNAYVKASVLHEFGGAGSVEIGSGGSGISFPKDFSGTWCEIGLGTNINMSEDKSLYLDVERSFGGEIDKQWQVTLGFRKQF